MQLRNAFTTKPFTPSHFEETADGFLRVKARVLKECVMPYSRDELAGVPDEVQGDMIPILVNLEEMTTPEALRTLESAQVVAPDHEWVTPENYGAISKGNAAGAARIVGPYAEIDLLVTDPQAIADIKTGKIGEISAGYHGDIVFEPGEHQGRPYAARQVGLRYNHIAVIEFGHGRAGKEVRILNHNPAAEGDKVMSDVKLVRVKLANGRFVNTDEEGAASIAAMNEGVDQEKKRSLDEVMNDLKAKNGENATLQSEIEELRGELSVYKEKLDQLLSTEAIEHAASEQVAEQGEADEILENTLPDDEKKPEIKNSVRGKFGNSLHVAVLTACGVKVENMSPEAVRGAFKAQHQIANSFKGRKPVVAGTRLQNGMTVDVPGARTAHERLFGKK